MRKPAVCSRWLVLLVCWLTPGEGIGLTSVFWWFSPPCQASRRSTSVFWWLSALRSGP